MSFASNSSGIDFKWYHKYTNATVPLKGYKQCCKRISLPTFQTSLKPSQNLHLYTFDFHRPLDETSGEEQDFTNYLRSLPIDSNCLNRNFSSNSNTILRRTVSMPSLNEKRNKIVSALDKKVDKVAQTIWPLPQKVLELADKNVRSLTIKKKLDLESDPFDLIESVGDHYVHIGAIYGPEKFYVIANYQFYQEFSKKMAQHNWTTWEVLRESDINSDTLYALCDELNVFIKRVYVMMNIDIQVFTVYDFDTGEIAFLEKKLISAYLKHLPDEFQYVPPLASPVRLGHDVSESDFNRYITSLKKIGLLHVVNFEGNQLIASVTSPADPPDASWRFCSYMYCGGDCYLRHEWELKNGKKFNNNNYTKSSHQY